MAQIAMYDITMTKVLEYFVWPDVIEAINAPKTPKALLHQLYYMPCIPTTSTCFRRWVMDTYGPFDTDYYLIEDYPFHLKLAEAGVKMRYENFVSARHRDGGISHGAVTALSVTKQRYYMDIVRSRRKVLASIKTGGASRELTSLNQHLAFATERLVLTTGTGRKGQLAYFKKYPLEFLIERSHTATKSAACKWVCIALIFALMLVLLPQLAAVCSLPSLLVTAAKLLLWAGTVLAGAIALLKGIMLWLYQTGKFPEVIQ
jgi:hypothetical protein